MATAKQLSDVMECSDLHRCVHGPSSAAVCTHVLSQVYKDVDR